MIDPLLQIAVIFGSTFGGYKLIADLAGIQSYPAVQPEVYFISNLITKNRIFFVLFRH